MNVGELKKLIENLPDDMPVMTAGPSGPGGFIPVRPQRLTLKVRTGGMGMERAYKSTDSDAVDTLILWW